MALAPHVGLQGKPNPAGDLAPQVSTVSDPAKGLKRKRKPSARLAEDSLQCDRWEKCSDCGAWVNLGTQDASSCQACGKEVSKVAHKALEYWAQCDLCGKWRAISAEVAGELDDCEDASWQCRYMGGGRTCKTSALEWGAVVRRAAQQQELTKRQHGLAAELAQRLARPGEEQPCTVQWQAQQLPISSQLPEYIPGRDTLISAEQLAAGLDAFDTASGEHVLWATAAPPDFLTMAAPAALRVLELHASGGLKDNVDGRASAGQLDLAAFLAQPSIQETLRQACRGGQQTCNTSCDREAAGVNPAWGPIRVSPDGRKAGLHWQG
ncbi:hypothetical protein WJX73_004826 [Symbiochloris irregularis]|uniref:CW-type domain-containing protein n=1 Tax=Symbiochloris irregularis TaxID=706552 RepID=A0AAW1NQ76_9CHLO